MKFLSKLEKTREFWFLFITSIFFFILRFPSLFEPDWYGDEGVYQVLGMGIRQGRLLYRDIFDNKPPMLYVFYSFFNGDQFWLRMLSLFFGLGALIAFFYLSKKLLENKNASYVSTVIFAVLFGIPLIEGNIANAENFMLLPIILGGLLLVPKNKIKFKYLIAGLLVGFAFLIKIVALFDFAAFLLFIVFSEHNFSFKKLITKTGFLETLKKIYPFILGFILPIFLTTLVFISRGAFGDFIHAIFFSNIGYVGYGNEFLIPQGLLILKLAGLFLFSWLVFAKRNSLKSGGLFIYLWLAFSLYNAFFSQRPYTHYMLILLPSFCLLIGFLLSNSAWRKFTLVIILATLVLTTQNFWFFTKTTSYYQNFLSFIAGRKSVVNYQKFFDSNTPANYDLATYINSDTNKNDSVFIWGNNAQIYKLTDKMPPGKYTVAYHILSYKDGLLNTQKGLNLNKPKLIIIMPNVPNYPFSLVNYKLKINIDTASVYERIF